MQVSAERTVVLHTICLISPSRLHVDINASAHGTATGLGLCDLLGRAKQG